MGVKETRYGYDCRYQQDDEEGHLKKLIVVSGHIQTNGNNEHDYIQDGIAGLFGAVIDYIRDN